MASLIGWAALSARQLTDNITIIWAAAQGANYPPKASPSATWKGCQKDKPTSCTSCIWTSPNASSTAKSTSKTFYSSSAKTATGEKASSKSSGKMKPTSSLKKSSSTACVPQPPSQPAFTNPHKPKKYACSSSSSHKPATTWTKASDFTTCS